MVGSVYSFAFDKVFSAEVLRISYSCEAENYGVFIRGKVTVDGDEIGLKTLDFSEIGTRYFLTKSEAEAKLINK